MKLAQKHYKADNIWSVRHTPQTLLTEQSYYIPLQQIVTCAAEWLTPESNNKLLPQWTGSIKFNQSITMSGKHWQDRNKINVLIKRA